MRRGIQGQRRKQSASSVTRKRRGFASQAIRFFAGFCLIANGAYLAIGQFDGVGDAGDLLRGGVPRWILIAVGLISVAGGLLPWHRLGPQARRSG